MTPEARKISDVFVRKASGLIREFSWSDVFALNMLGASIGMMFALSPSMSIFARPDSDILFAQIFYFLPAIAFALIYALFSMTMPRSGGDYVFMSRGLHPALGFIVNFGFIIAIVYVGGNWANFITTIGIQPALAILGLSLNNSNLLNASYTIVEPQNILIIGTIGIAVACAMVAFLKPKIYAKVQMAIFLFGMVGVILVLILLATSTPLQFQSAFNSLATSFGAPPNYYTYVQQITPATPPPTLWGSLAAGAPFIFLSYGYGVFFAGYVAGEIKRVKRSQTIGCMTSIVLQLGLMAAAIWLLYEVIGRNFYTSLNYLWYTYSPEYFIYPIGPYLNFLANILNTNPVLTIIIAIGFIVWAFMPIPIIVLGASRCFVAWGMDRLIPAKLTEISPRFLTPTKAILAIFIIMELFFVWYTYNPLGAFTMWWGLFISFIMFGALGLAGILFPYVKKEIYAASPIAKYKVLGLPILTIVGVIQFFFNGILSVYIMAVDEGWATIAAGSITQFILVVTTFVIAGIIYAAMRAYRKRQGLDLSLAYRELPPE